MFWAQTETDCERKKQQYLLVLTGWRTGGRISWNPKDISCGKALQA